MFVYPRGPLQLGGDHVASGNQRALQVDVQEPAPVPHPAGLHDLLRGRLPDAHTYGHPQVCQRRGEVLCARHAVCHTEIVCVHPSPDGIWQHH
ncbi:hypothetical protein DPMN_072614 [Dreissena polymorpha]|uniref:Uncharacterized protein n=1 Tax=Dreissena polymorpha TaxID=45954 RepID=A0A9D4H9N4_DREPO|nr:hypothetical protein DPMN_072614 [Dreissena polymorpha]